MQKMVLALGMCSIRDIQILVLQFLRIMTEMVKLI